MEASYVTARPPTGSSAETDQRQREGPDQNPVHARKLARAGAEISAEAITHTIDVAGADQILSADGAEPGDVERQFRAGDDGGCGRGQNRSCGFPSRDRVPRVRLTSR